MVDIDDTIENNDDAQLSFDLDDTARQMGFLPELGNKPISVYRISWNVHIVVPNTGAVNQQRVERFYSSRADAQDAAKDILKAARLIGITSFEMPLTAEIEVR